MYLWMCGYKVCGCVRECTKTWQIVKNKSKHIQNNNIRKQHQTEGRQSCQQQNTPLQNDGRSVRYEAKL